VRVQKPFYESFLAKNGLDEAASFLQLFHQLYQAKDFYSQAVACT